ncbi:MAG: AraC family transcriptional regulator [Chitinophagaceae bacterium]
MLFEFNFYSSLLLIFFVHGLVYAILMFRKGIINEHVSDKWLALFLLLCILYIAPWMIGFAGWYDNQPYRDILFYTPFQHLFVIGPVVFFYVQSLLNPSFRFSKKQAWHFVPGILYLLFSVTMFVTDKLVLKRYYFLADGADPDFDAWYQYTGFFSMLVYFVLSLRYYQLYCSVIVQLVSYAEQVLFRWVRNFLLAFLLMLVVRIGFNLLAILVPTLGNYWGTWWYFLSFAIIFYYIAITGYSNAIETKVSFRVQHLLTYKPQLLLQYQPRPQTVANAIIEDAVFIEINSEAATTSFENTFPLHDWKQKITALFTTGLVYEDPELSLTDLAKRLETNPSVLSKIINQGFNQNFNDFVNRYRVKAVQEKLLAGEQQTQTLLGIAYDCGFNSKATFNRAFKKEAGTSPKDWIALNIASA